MKYKITLCILTLSFTNCRYAYYRIPKARTSSRPFIVISTPGNKYPSATDIDQIISTEIPSHEDDPELYRLVQNHMIHGPCGILQPNSPCMKEGKCSRFYPKQF